jgi:hypothetical protein
MNLLKELETLDKDSLSLAIARMTTGELMGLARPIANTPKKWQGPGVAKMYGMICEELKYRNPGRWIDLEQELERLQKRVGRIEPFLNAFKK